MDVLKTNAGILQAKYQLKHGLLGGAFRYGIDGEQQRTVEFKPGFLRQNAA